MIQKINDYCKLDTKQKICFYKLTENRDPVANMLGDRFATIDGADNSIYRYIEEITKEFEVLAKQAEGSEEKAQELEEKKLVLSLRLKLLRLDEQMLNASIIKISKYVFSCLQELILISSYISKNKK